MIVYTINPDPWEHIFWTLAVMGGTGTVVSFIFWLAIRPLHRELFRLHRRMAKLEKRLAEAQGKEHEIPITLLDELK